LLDENLTQEGFIDAGNAHGARMTMDEQGAEDSLPDPSGHLANFPRHLRYVPARLSYRAAGDFLSGQQQNLEDVEGVRSASQPDQPVFAERIAELLGQNVCDEKAPLESQRFERQNKRPHKRSHHLVLLGRAKLLAGL
jgi:hypothetical protein